MVLMPNGGLDLLTCGAGKPDRPSVDDIVTWFNAWLEKPITERERVIIGEVFHCIDYPGDVRRAVERAPKLAEYTAHSPRKY